MARKRSQPFQLGETSVAPGTQERVLLPAARLYSDTPLDLHVEVLHGTKPGPVLFGVCRHPWRRNSMESKSVAD